ncbi:MAG: hypothetical protein DHS20C02_09040 [Micavibrio sp.]|nr:MAG: hypothetical protein DHS20C02_09040 [Micavibrio sp.]
MLLNHKCVGRLFYDSSRLHNPVKGISHTASYDPEKHAIKRILLVGASEIYEEDFFDDSLDRMLTKSAITTALDLGISFNRTFEIETIDIKRGEGLEEDFLRGKFLADMVITANIFNPKLTAKEAQSFQGSMPDFFCNGIARSPLHYVPGSWHDAAVRAGAKVIICRGRELRADTFVRENFSELVLPQEVHKDNGYLDHTSIACTDDFAAAHGFELMPRPSNTPEVDLFPHQG